jgi:thiol-disulfide isomerase/thioredoxin
MDDAYDIESLRMKSEPISKYLDGAQETTQSFSKQLENYRLDERVAKSIEGLADGVVVFVFSAEWCPDCYMNVPVLKLLQDATGIEVNVFGHLKKGDRDAGELWEIPPSPPEVADFDVRKIPLIVVLNHEGEVLGEIVENPPEGQTLEEAFLKILEAASDKSRHR